MKYLNSTFFSHTYQYIYENLSCLLYVVEVIPEQTMYFTSYFALVKDIAEAYGSWVALTIVIMSAVLTMVSVQQLVTLGSDYFKLSGGKVNTLSNMNNSTTDLYFTNFNFFKFFK